jgi:hypothetical protein
MIDLHYRSTPNGHKITMFLRAPASCRIKAALYRSD